ncbi:MAG: flagellar biosynthesis anti-sigma factor FlgM [Nitrosomonadales bacterium]|nr:flagellar biosynthesis anti-sigma factor FlgM [Nitrosomonadales bacterium]
MKIDKPGNSLPASSAGESTARVSGKDKSGQASAAKQPAGTNVSLGSTAAHVQSMESSMANTPVVNAAKVAEIRQAISEGRFQVNTSAVADRLIATVRDLIGGKI